MTDHPTDPLLDELRRLARAVDPVPDEVTAYARAALGWRRVDAELAELLADSRLEALSSTRSAAETARSLTFRSQDLQVDVDLQDEDGSVLLLGQLAPPLAGEIEVQRDDGSTVATARSDELGRFRIELPAGGRIRLVVRREPPAAVIETSWIDV
jgi:hypothetical protein